MNSGYLLKRIISVEDEERLTSPAILRSSSSHTPYSNDTSGSPSTTSSPACVVSLLVSLERSQGRSLYSLKGRFPPSLSMETSITIVERIGGNLLPRGTWTGFSPGSADPLTLPFATAFAQVTNSWVLGPFTCGPQFCTSVCFDNWALFLSVTQVWIFCAFVLRLVLVLIFSLFHVWVPTNQEPPTCGIGQN